MTAHDLRQQYTEVINKPDRIKALIAEMDNIAEANAVQQAYRAALEAMLAPSEWMPLQKLVRVQKAMTLFDKAVKADDNDPEIRLLRFAVSQRIPAFLGIKTYLDDDADTIAAQAGKLPQPLPELHKNILETIAQSGKGKQQQTTEQIKQILQKS